MPQFDDRLNSGVRDAKAWARSRVLLACGICAAVGVVIGGILF